MQDRLKCTSIAISRTNGTKVPSESRAWDAAPRRIVDIEILRAMAIGLVMAQHAYLQLVLNQRWLLNQMVGAPMWCGVDLFFVISGFVITRSLLPGVLSQPNSGLVLARFWLRRVFRLWPAGWTWLLLIFAGSAIFRRPPIFHSWSDNLPSVLAGALGYADYWFPRHFLSHYGPSYPYWSLSLEEQFYALLPPVMLVARGRLWLFAALALAIQLPLRHPILYQFLRNDGLLWGVLIAASPRMLRGAPVAGRALQRIPLGGPIVLAFAIAAMTQLSPGLTDAPRFKFGLLAACAAIPLWLASANLDLFRAGVWQPFLLWLASRSYVLYLSHVPLYLCASALARRIGETNAVLGRHTDLCSVAIALPMLAALAEIIHRTIEKPVRKWGYRHIDRWLWPGGALPEP